MHATRINESCRTHKFVYVYWHYFWNSHVRSLGVCSCFFHSCDMTYSEVRHYSFMCVPWLIHMWVLYLTTLQHAATHCNTLQYTATHCNTLQHTATHCNTLQYTATHCNTLQHTATYCNALQYTAIHCNTLQHTATQYNTLQHAVTHYIMLQHTSVLFLTFAWFVGYDSETFFIITPLLVSRYLPVAHAWTRCIYTAHCNTLQHPATRCNNCTLQHAATRCNKHSFIITSLFVSRYLPVACCCVLQRVIDIPTCVI